MARKKQRKRCKECIAEGITTHRVAKYPGPRCYTHHRAFKNKRKDYTHSEHIMRLYGLTSEEYWQIYRFQGGTCAICQRATGARRKLAVDHDHATGAVRMLACTRCNRMMGHLRDDPEAFERAAECLRNPPADLALGRRHYVPLGGAPVKGNTYDPVTARLTTTESTEQVPRS